LNIIIKLFKNGNLSESAEEDGGVFGLGFYNTKVNIPKDKNIA